MPEFKKSVEVAPKVVAEPPTEFVKMPRTASEVEVARLKLAAAVKVVAAVEVALPLITQPPDPELKMMFVNVEDPGAMLLPKVVALKVTVPPLEANIPEDAMRDPPTENVPAGKVVVPATNVMFFTAVALVSMNDHEPPAPAKVILYALEPLRRTVCADVPLK